MMALPLGHFLFRSIRTLGSGGLGTVDEIEVTASNCDYEVGKRLARKQLNKKWAQVPHAQQRFEREIAATKRMSHPNVISFRGENIAGSKERFYVMEIFPSTLRQRLHAKGGGYPWREVALFGCTMCRALAHAHAHGFIHRDIKPENILLDPSNRAVIADWGLGYFIHKESKVLEQLTRGGMGTAYYCSMEQWATGKCDQTGDVYSLGVLLSELVVGRQVPMQYIGGGIHVDVVRVTGVGAQAFNQTIKQMTQLLPAARPRTMIEVEYLLADALRIGDSVSISC